MNTQCPTYMPAYTAKAHGLAAFMNCTHSEDHVSQQAGMSWVAQSPESTAAFQYTGACTQH